MSRSRKSRVTVLLATAGLFAGLFISILIWYFFVNINFFRRRLACYGIFFSKPMCQFYVVSLFCQFPFGFCYALFTVFFIRKRIIQIFARRIFFSKLLFEGDRQVIAL